MNRIYRLSLHWMEDHIPLWPEDAGDPPVGGPYRTRLWEGELSQQQIEEILSRADFYATMTGADAWDNRALVGAAKSVLKRLREASNV